MQEPALHLYQGCPFKIFYDLHNILKVSKTSARRVDIGQYILQMFQRGHRNVHKCSHIFAVFKMCRGSSLIRKRPPTGVPRAYGSSSWRKLPVEGQMAKVADIRVSATVETTPVDLQYRGTSLTRKRTPLEPYRRPMPRVLGGS